MRISLLYIQQNKTRNANDFEDHFLKKLKNNMDINISNIPIKKKFNSKSQQVAYEGDLLLEKIGKNNFICFDKIGRKMSSEEFSKDLYKSNEKIFLVIGGAFGLSEEIKKNALKIISFSDMEFSHEVFRVMLLEQIYRAYCIFNNHPYHQN
ncbi:MAG: 23S rRNA (pseudouridine(1915)-N(3))-methyltransferase RlmH [Gammaproteobacteria bacterium]|jgi:23S rRNA (pseudouridine1915-N3)-methyltransferase|tara:strand:- start:1295 stop:1747 length:453 start_codon:yes stop_codon:yes gene_type:complete